METLQQPTKTKAKKVHRCDFCNAKIDIGETYYKSVHKYDVVYSWKTHIRCAAIADTLKMYDDADEGVTTEDFFEAIKQQYRHIMRNHFIEEYESKDFKYPDFITRLNFVIAYYNSLESKTN